VALSALQMALAEAGKEKEALAASAECYAVVYGATELRPLMDSAYAEGGFAAAMRRGAEALAVRAASGGALPTDVASLYAYAGDNARALDWLERAYQARDPNLPYLRLPVYDPLRSEPRFQALMREMNLLL